MKEFTKEMLDKLYGAFKETQGTPQYTKYLMQYDYKEGKRWHFCMHAVPHKPGIIKTVKGKTYIICEGWQTDGNRYHVTEAVAELLGL